MIKINLEKLNSQIYEQIKSNNFEGYDPFDYLNSKIFKKTIFNNFYLSRLVWTQFGKRFPLNLRSILRVNKERNPKGIALIIIGLLSKYSYLKEEEILSQARELGYWLVQNKCDQSIWKYPCWGYNFDWQSKAFFLKKGTPNIIVTVYVSRALYQLGLALKNEDLINTSLNSSLFINEFLYFSDLKKSYYKYVPNSDTFVHNANLWGCYWSQKTASINNLDLIKKNSELCIHESIKSQNRDGSWFYGTKSHHKFIDGFHTGYNLEALYLINNLNKSDLLNISINKGYNFYLKNLFTKDGIAKYYHDKTYPLDAHNFTQGIITICLIKKDKESLKFVEKLLYKLFQKMYLNHNYTFSYQVNKFFRNDINYIRWTQSWCFYAVNLYLKKINT